MYSYDGSHLEGEAVIAKPGNGSFVEVGRMAMVKWGDVTRDSLNDGEQVFKLAQHSHHSTSGVSSNATHTGAIPARGGVGRTTAAYAPVLATAQQRRLGISLWPLMIVMWGIRIALTTWFDACPTKL
jgi:hypothetical protein